MTTAEDARGYRSRASAPLREDLALALIRTGADLEADGYDVEAFDQLDTIAREAVVRLATRYAADHRIVLAVGLADASEMLRSPFRTEAVLVVCPVCGRDQFVRPGSSVCNICHRAGS